MTRLSVYILILSLFLLAACDSAKKEFETLKEGEILLDINTEEYSLNGLVIGKTATDISNSDDLLIEPLDNELKEIRRVEQEEALRKGIPADESSNARLHFDENLSYDVFYKVMATMGFSGYVSFQYVIGSNFREPLSVDLPERSSSLFSDEGINSYTCQRAKLRKQNSELLVECARKFIELFLAIKPNGNGVSYLVGLNESGLIDGQKIYTYENIDDVWKLIEDIRLRRELQEKEDRDQIVVVLERNILVKNLVPVVKKLKIFGYKVNFANFE